MSATCVTTRGLSQTLPRAVGRAGSASILHFVNLSRTEAEREQPVLLAHRPGTRKPEALAQPQRQGQQAAMGGCAKAGLWASPQTGKRPRSTTKLIRIFF